MPTPITLPTFTFLHGPKGVGKTTLARTLFDASAAAGDRPIIYHNGYPVYRAAEAILDYMTPRETLESAEFKSSGLPWGGAERGRTGRTLLVALGQFLRDEISPEYFGHQALEYVQELAPYHNKFIIDGVRFEDEICPLFEAFPHHSKLFITLYREGYGWKDDLGAYFLPAGQFCTDLHVDRTGPPEDCVKLLTHALEHTAQMGQNLS